MKENFIIPSREFYAHHPKVVAQKLLGMLLVRILPDNNVLVGKIVETEAYLGTEDPASHSFIGKTKRNNSMFKDAGHAYVYRMRQYCLFNVVTETRDIGSAVLIRAIEPLNGFDQKENVLVNQFGKSFTNGPGKLCKAFNITHALDGIDITDQDSELFIAQNPKRETTTTTTTTRIGISKGKEMLLRFYLEENPHVSRKKWLSKGNYIP